LLKAFSEIEEAYDMLSPPRRNEQVKLAAEMAVLRRHYH
jgi:hypothetical protein